MLVEDMNDVLSGGVRGVSGSLDNSEPIISIQADGVVPHGLNQFAEKEGTKKKKKKKRKKTRIFQSRRSYIRS